MERTIYKPYTTNKLDTKRVDMQTKLNREMPLWKELEIKSQQKKALLRGRKKFIDFPTKKFSLLKALLFYIHIWLFFTDYFRVR